MASQIGLLGIPAPAPKGKKKPDVERDAFFSPAPKTWRWWLSRFWDHNLPIGLVCTINPSTGSDKDDDSTIANLMKRARFWGWGGFYIVNLCAFVSSHPDDLHNAPQPVGAHNDATIARLAAEVTQDGGRIVAAWGSSVDFSDPGMRPALLRRDQIVLEALIKVADVYCIGRSGPGHRSPTHPLARGKHRVPDDAPLQVFRTMDGQAPKGPTKVVSVAEKPPHAADLPPLACPSGPCAFCGAHAVGRYGAPESKIVGAPIVPICDKCGPGYHPTLPELWERIAERKAGRA